LRFFVTYPVRFGSQTGKIKNFSTSKPSPCRALLSAFLPSFFKCPSLQGFTGVLGAVFFGFFSGFSLLCFFSGFSLVFLVFFGGFFG